MQRANELVRARIHPTSIMSGYRLAMKEAVKYIKSNLTVSADRMEREFLMNAAKTSMSSKIIGANADFFANMVVDAVSSVRVDGADGKSKYPISNINVLKSHGRSATESVLVRGFALNGSRASQAMPRVVRDARIALVDFNLQRHRMQLGIQVLVTDPAKLEAIRQREADITRDKIMKIIRAGANVILTTKGIDDLCMKYLVENGVLGIRRCKKEDLRRIGAATGGVLLPNLADLEGEESFDPANLGHAEEVAQERVGDGELTFIRGCKTTRAVSIVSGLVLCCYFAVSMVPTVHQALRQQHVGSLMPRELPLQVLRGANEFLLDEMDRSLHDSLCIVQRVLESKSIVAGGGAVETALSIYLDNFATTLGTKEQLAIKEFAEALLVIPKTLAVNAAQDATELVAKLCSYHHTAQHVVSSLCLHTMCGHARASFFLSIVAPSLKRPHPSGCAASTSVREPPGEDIRECAVAHTAAQDQTCPLPTLRGRCRV